jgi:CBS domain-containing protein
VQSELVQVKLSRIGRDASIRDAMAAMLEDHVHRVYVVDDMEEELPLPVAIITTSDIMEIIAKYSQL